MKYALIKNNKVELISYQSIEGFVEVNDNVFADMIKKSDGSFDYSNEFKAKQEQSRLIIEQEKANKQSALTKLSALGLTEAEIKAIIG